MPRLASIAGAASIGGALWDALLFKRFLSDIAAIMVLTIITGVMAGALLLGGYYGFMLLLIQHGLDAEAALLTVGGMVAAIAIVSAAFVVGYIRRLRSALQPLSPLTSGISDIANAFVDGLLTRSEREKKHSD